MGLMEDFICKVGITLKEMTWVHYAPNIHELNLNNNIMTVWLQQKLFLLLLSEMLLVDFKFFFILPALLWWGSNNIAVTRVYEATICVRLPFSRVQTACLVKAQKYKAKISAYATKSWKVI